MGKLRRLAGLICIVPAWAGAAPLAYVPIETPVSISAINTVAEVKAPAPVAGIPAGKP